MNEQQNILNKVGNLFLKIWSRLTFKFKNGSIHTKISHFVMGYGNFARKQIAKGLIFLGVQVVFLAMMFVSPMIPEAKATPLGFQALLNLRHLGTNPGSPFIQGDNSLLMLLYGVFTIIIIISFIVIYTVSINSSYKLDKLVEDKKSIPSFKEDLFELTESKFHFTLLTPATIGILVLTIIPNIFMILVAFTNFDNNHLPPGQLFTWVGFVNFSGLFNANNALSGFWGVLAWTLTWAVIATFSNYILGILLATLINSKLVKAKKLWRTIFVLTIAIPQFVSLLLVRYLFAELGPINTFLVDMGWLEAPMNFLGNANNAFTPRVMVLIINLWVGIPFTMLMTSGILMNVPSDLYEAAQIDGATKPQIFRKITFPYIVFITTPYLISSFMGNITSFNIIFLLTGGGPGQSGPNPGKTDLLVTWLFRLTVEEYNYSLGAVVSILTFILMAIGTLITYRRSKAYKDEGAFQ